MTYSNLWDDDREAQVIEFVEKDLIIQEVREEFLKYENLFEEIKSIPDFHLIGPLEIIMGKIKFFCFQ